MTLPFSSNASTPAADPLAAHPLVLPPAPASGQRTEPLSAAAPGTLPPGKIMIIDDEIVNVRVLKRYLSGVGYTDIVTTTDSATAMALIERENPDLLLLDIMMPDVSGIDILRMLREHRRYRHLPVLIVTANADLETKRVCLELGATDFLHKPVDPLDLLPRVRNTLITKSFQDQLAGYAQQLEKRVAQRTRELEASRKQVVQCLARAAEYRDTETGNHIIRVGRFAGVIAKQLGFTDDEVNNIEMAAQLHDVGKIAIPDAILHKPGKLDPEEFDYIKRHAALGHSIVRPHSPEDAERLREHVTAGGQLLIVQSSPLLRLAASIALSHHERWDGTGYPLGLKGEDIPLEARITSVADVFDALSSVRPYKGAMPRERCFEILTEGRGTQFDPRVLDAFFAQADAIVEIQKELVDIPVM
ncbi:MAG: HD domain-containing phosphohydrolase [Planctomycetaceae bacterium]